MLEENTASAFKEGAFGLPWWVAENPAGEKETFWGIDHMGLVVDHLGLQNPTAESMSGRGWGVML